MYSNFNGGFLAGFMGAGMIVGWILAFIALWVFTVLIRWKMFQKAGEAGWKSIIPIYGDYVEYRLSLEDGTKYFWIQLIASVASGALLFIPFIGPAIFMCGMIVAYVISVLQKLALGKSFNKDLGFGIGLLMFGPVFQMFLAFNKATQYIGPQKSELELTKKYKVVKEEDYSENNQM